MAETIRDRIPKMVSIVERRPIFKLNEVTIGVKVEILKSEMFWQG